MKCPYRYVESTVRCGDTVVRKTTDFADCLKEECPNYGEKIRHFNVATHRWETLTAPVCRRRAGA